MKKLIYLLAFLMGSASLFAQTVTIDTAAGWLESAYVTWKPVTGADSYNVYYTGGSVTNQQIDEQLIRSYGSYYRADIPGLAAGSYTVKVVPVTSSTEGTGTTSSAITVLANDRSGFAFSNGYVPGAYNSDGTPKSGAVVLYITENTKNTVSMDVNGAGTCTGLQNILYGYKKGDETRPLILRLIGQVTDPTTLDKGDIVIENDLNSSSPITLEGIGSDATVDGWGIRLKNSSSVEIRNLGIMNVNSDEGDDIGLQQDNEHIWVHNCDFFYGDAGSDADQVKGDGALDCKKSTYITFSYNHFWDNGKCNLLGLSEGTTDGLYITYHHNWYDHSDSRHPRVRFYSAHVYNNYYDGNAKYGIGSTEGSSVFSEGNYFRSCKYPMLISMQGSDVWDEDAQANDYGDMPTFSSEDGGIIKAYNNYMEGQHRFVAYGDDSYTNSTVDFDAYVVESRSTTVPSTVTSAYGGNTYNNFDTDNSVMYSYTADSPENAKTNVTAYAGRTEGGDFQWTFDNSVDDTAYSVNTGLKTALTSYTTTLSSIQGDGDGTGSTISSSSETSSSSSSTEGSSSSSSGGGTAISADIVHNFTTDGTTSSYFTISGNLSTSKGTVTYNDLTLTQCLKMESATTIDFTLDAAATLTLVFNSDFSGSVNINGTSYTVSGGILTVSLEAGSYTITKGDSSNLYYMSIAFEATSAIASAKAEPVQMELHRDRLYITGTAQIRLVEFIRPNGSRITKTGTIGRSVDLQGLSAGIYLVRISTTQGLYQKTIFRE